MDTSGEVGPVYGVELIDTLPLGTGCMRQQMPSHDDLKYVRSWSERTVAGYEVLLAHYYDKVSEIERLKELIRTVIAGPFVLTELQEAIGDLAEKPTGAP